MTRVRSYMVSGLAGATVLVLAGASVTASASPGSARARLRQEVAAVVAAGATGASAEVDDGTHRVRAVAGTATLGSSRPVPAGGRFRAGSVTKTFVGAVVLQLVDEHRLGLDDTVDDVLPGVLPAGTGITVRELLNHTSGLPDILTTLPRPTTPEFLALRWHTWSQRELVARVADRPLLFTPGSEASYSNTNYLLLGLIVERVTGKPFHTEIERRIIRPLGLSGTSVPGADPSIHGPHAHGYLPVEQSDGSVSVVDITAINPTVLGFAGEIISTTRDLNRFYAALFDGTLLPPYLVAQMRTPAAGSVYGLGVIQQPLSCGITAWGKDGDAPGYSTWVFSAPDDSRRVTVSATWGRTDHNKLGDAVDDLLDAELCP